MSNFGLSLLSSITTADFNNDGKLDLAVARLTDGRISTLLNDGSGGFPTDGFSAPNIFVGFQLPAIKAGDFNNDTKADLFVITPNFSSANYVVLLGTGSGTFTNIGGGSLQGPFSFSEQLDIGDFNSDGKLDVAVIRSGVNIVHVLQGDGTGHFSDNASLSIDGTPISVLVRDLNSDGKPDIAVSNSIVVENFTRQALITVLMNNGAGFNPAVNYPTDVAGFIGSGDFNSDNKPDLVVTSAALFFGSNLDGIAVITNKGNGEFNAAVNTPTGSRSDDLVVSDFNNDGKDDIAVSQLVGSVAFLLNDFTSSQPCLSINDVSITENDTGTIEAIFTVKLSAASAQTVRVNYFATPAFLPTSLSGATTGADFENVPDTLIFLPGETTKTITVRVKGDVLDEIDQFFHVVLTTPINASISDGKGVGTIVDNDAPPAITISDTTVTEGTQTQSQAVFTVTLNAPSEKLVTVQFTLEAGTASPNIDYANFTSGVGFSPGTVSAEISIPIIQDNIFEPNETFFVNLSNPTEATIADGQAQGTINNDDPQPTISISPASFLTEGATGTTVNAQFDVTLSNPSSQTITVSFATADGTATAGSDYVALSGTLTFNPGETSKSISVQVTGDNTDEINETFFVNLSNPANATITAAQGVGTIMDDDGPTLSINSVSVTEGQSGFTNAVFTVTLSAPSVQDVTVIYATAGGTATSNIDFQRVFLNTLVIPAGATSGTLTVFVIGDLQIEPDEQFTVNLQSPGNATIANGQGTGTIVNDDSNGKLQFSSPTYIATEDAGSVVVSVSRVDGATGVVTVDFAANNGTATSGSDYTTTSGTLVFAPGETSKSFSIPIINDGVLEVDETVNLTLSNPTGGATLGSQTTAILTIQTPPLILVLDESGPGSHQSAALDSLLLMRDPFPVIQVLDLLNPGPDRNTRVIVFLANLQLAPGDVASIVKVNLFDSLGQSHDVDAEDVRAVPFSNFVQVTFRLPDNLRVGVATIKVRSRDQESNLGTIRIRN